MINNNRQGHNNDINNDNNNIKNNNNNNMNNNSNKINNINNSGLKRCPLNFVCNNLTQYEHSYKKEQQQQSYQH